MTEKLNTSSGTYELPNEGEVREEPWEDEAEANSEDLKREEGLKQDFILHPEDGKIVDPSKVDKATANEAKEKITRFRLEKFSKRGHLIRSLFKEEKLAA